MAAEQHVIWRPQPGPQAQLVTCPVAEIFYGGARGGGKTDGMFGKNAIKAERYGKHQKGMFFRRTLKQLSKAKERCKELYLPLGWKWANGMMTAPNGATLEFAYLDHDKDAENYQGHDYTDLYFEELTNFPDPKPVNKLRATLRSAAGVPCQFHATGNPGGPGHNWVKSRYIDPNPNGFEVLTEELPDGSEHQRVFIPARLSDNPALLENDPRYVANLYLSGSEQLVRAWLDGDWNVIDGAFFDCWTQRMVLRPFDIPADWLRFRSFDWGSAKPFSVGWWAIAGDDYQASTGLVPRGAMIRYREWYGMKKGTPNVGLKMTAEKVSEGIVQRTNEEVGYSVADPAIFAEDGGPSIAERMRPIYWKPADNKRVAQRGQMGGWDQMRQRMIGTRTVAEDGRILDDGDPMLYCFSTCAESIRTIPVLQHDTNRAEDLDTSAEDHAADEWRYGCMSRPWLRAVATTNKPDTDAWGRPKSTSSWKTG